MKGFIFPRIFRGTLIPAEYVWYVCVPRTHHLTHTRRAPTAVGPRGESRQRPALCCARQSAPPPVPRGRRLCFGPVLRGGCSPCGKGKPRAALSVPPPPPPTHSSPGIAALLLEAARAPAAWRVAKSAAAAATFPASRHGGTHAVRARRSAPRALCLGAVRPPAYPPWSGRRRGGCWQRARVLEQQAAAPCKRMPSFRVTRLCFPRAA